jgi:AraC-like DNA-binding protein
MAIDTKICFINTHNTKSNQFKPHTHNCYEIIYFAAGRGKVFINGKSYQASTGSYCIIPPYAEHVEELEGYSEIFFIGFEFNSPSYTLKEGSYYIDTITKHSYFNDIFDEFKKQQSGFEIAAEYLLRLVLVTLLRNANTNNIKCKDLNYIKEYIDQYADQKINFGQLALLSGYSYDYFRYMFKRKFGLSPQEYMIDVRLENAKRLLETSTLSCTEIAYDCGFSNSAQMTSMFKKKYGKTPKTFKITD